MGITKVKISGLILGPVVFIILLRFPGFFGLSLEASRVVSLAAWMIIWWVTEAIPIFVTALLPMVCLPLLGIFSIAESTVSYANPIIFLFMGGFIIAIGLEKHNLHSRIALNLIKLTGTNVNGIILGFMIATAFLSMWISNTATTVMMLPIAMSVVNLLQKPVSDHSISEQAFRKFSLGLMLSIAYSANIGGMATIIGTPPNVVLAGYIQQFYQIDLDFSKWLMIGFPISFTLLFFTYFLITRILFPSRIGIIPGSSQLMEDQLKALGKFTKEEKLVTIVFTLTAASWILRKPINQLIGENLLNDTIIAMTGGILMFLMPVKFKKAEFLLNWEDMKRLPWGILILFGGGLTLAKGLQETGIIQLIGSNIAGMPNISLWVMLLLLTTVMLFMTELMSNVALTTIFIPVVIGIAIGLDINGLIFAIPVTLAASCAFMMPISTPPNAIVFSSGLIRMKDMIRAGFLLNLISILVLMLAAYSIIQLVYGSI